MTWIRNPWWDGFWILSGVPFGAALTALLAGLPASTMILWIVLLTQTGHLLSPMALAWSHDGFRAIMLRRRIRFILAPLTILVGSALVGLIGSRSLPGLRFDPLHFAIAAGPTTLVEFKNPFMAMVALYAVWNAYHFGKQAFGVMSIYRHKRGGYDDVQRRIDKLFCCSVIWAAMLMPFIPRIVHGMHDLIGWPAGPHPFLDDVSGAYLAAALLLITGMLGREWRTGRSLPRALFILTDGLGLILIFHIGLWGFAIVGMNHWLVAIGLASHVHANREGVSPWPFALGLCLAGLLLFSALFVDPMKLLSGGISTAMLSFSAAAVGFRLGLGFVHFLYDRWIWRLSDPQVRETIGRDLIPEAYPLALAAE
jgi:hypothetical protein